MARETCNLFISQWADMLVKANYRYNSPRLLEYSDRFRDPVYYGVADGASASATAHGSMVAYTHYPY